jgi:hypothetical protein
MANEHKIRTKQVHRRKTNFINDNYRKTRGAAPFRQKRAKVEGESPDASNQNDGNSPLHQPLKETFPMSEVSEFFIQRL